MLDIYCQLVYNCHMLTIDDLLIKIEANGFENLSASIPARDRRILKNMAKLIRLPGFITESQGRLLIKILQENLESLNFIGHELIPSLKIPSWTKDFKVVNSVKRITVIKNADGVPLIDIEHTFNKDVKKTISELGRTLEGNYGAINGMHTYFLLTEKNVFNIVNGLKKYHFEKSSQIQSLYDEINAIDKHKYIKSFDIEEIHHSFLKTLLIEDIGTTENNLLLEDRKLKFQYSVNSGVSGDELVAKIATRKNNKIFINSNQYSLDEVAQSIRQLKRVPLLFIFDEYNVKSSLDNLILVKGVLDRMEITPNMGVYFRFPNEGQGEEFNKLVSDSGYNKKLDADNKISIIANGKLPKFFLKNSWYPKSVISFSNQLRNNKTSVYCNECDLIVYYNTTPPVIGTVDAIL